jgi:hypothetical protein
MLLFFYKPQFHEQLMHHKDETIIPEKTISIAKEIRFECTFSS